MFASAKTSVGEEKGFRLEMRTEARKYLTLSFTEIIRLRRMARRLFAWLANDVLLCENASGEVKGSRLGKEWNTSYVESHSETQD